MTWQSEALWENTIAGAGQQKDSTVTPLVFESIENTERNSTNERRNDAEADRAQAASALEHSLKLQEEMHAAEREESIRLAQLEERNRCEEEFSSAIFKEREAIARFCRQIGDERQHYFERVEAEIVRLSLGIAAQILHREVKLDPLLLTGVVQVALEQIQEGSDAILRVPKLDVGSWSSRLEGATNSLALSVVGDDGLNCGECVIETNIGTVSLGVEAQLAEIERGFFDLLKQRPT